MLRSYVQQHVRKEIKQMHG